MNSDTNNTSMEEKACEMLEQLSYTLYPPERLQRAGFQPSFYDPQYTIRQVLENKVSSSIPMEKREEYLAFGHTGNGGKDGAVYCGAIVTESGKKCGEFMYHSDTGKVDYFSMKEIERQRIEKTPYFDLKMVLMTPKDFTELCRKGMGLDDNRGRLHLRPLTEAEFERVAEIYTTITTTVSITKEQAEELKEKGEAEWVHPIQENGLEPTMDDIEWGYDLQEYYVPSEADRPVLMEQPVQQNYISPVYMSGIEQKITDMKETLAEMKKEKERQEDNDYAVPQRRTPY